jgi:hypothetical protein
MNSPVLTSEALALLDDVSDDVYGLWEVDWFFNGFRPTWEGAKRIELLADLIMHELVDVFFGRMEDDLDPLPRKSALTAVRNWDNWRSPEGADPPVYLVMTNEAGQMARHANTI